MIKERIMFDMSLTYDDLECVERIVNQGIDSRLEGFTQSTFYLDNSSGVLRLQCQVHSSELQVLIRRLLEDGDIHSEMLADDIVFVEYGYETV
jgi:hypothetical protein